MGFRHFPRIEPIECSKTPGRTPSKEFAVPENPCSACHAPVAHHYPPDPDLPLLGVWLCDQCVDPDIVRDRLSREENRYVRLRPWP
jgi:hypothetical protein